MSPLDDIRLDTYFGAVFVVFYSRYLFSGHSFVLSSFVAFCCFGFVFIRVFVAVIDLVIAFIQLL